MADKEEIKAKVAAWAQSRSKKQWVFMAMGVLLLIGLVQSL